MYRRKEGDSHMILRNINGKDLELELGKINYICPIDIVLGNEIYDYLLKYFSGFKYTEEYLSKYDNTYPLIEENGMEISRDDYLCIGVNSYKEIEELLQSKKGTIFYDYNNNLLNDIDVQKEIETIEMAYINIIKKISACYINESVIEIKDFTLHSDKLLSKEIGFNINYGSSIVDKFKLLIEMFSITEDRNLIFYLNNVDSYLSLKDLDNLLEDVRKYVNVKIIIQSNHPAYLEYSELEKIMYLKNNNIEFFPNNVILLKKINNNIKMNTTITNDQLIKWLRKYSIIFMENSNVIESIDYLIYEAISSKNKNIDDNESLMENAIVI